MTEQAGLAGAAPVGVARLRPGVLWRLLVWLALATVMVVGRGLCLVTQGLSALAVDVPPPQAH